jgi:uncharacterized protein YxjI
VLNRVFTSRNRYCTTARPGEATVPETWRRHDRSFDLEVVPRAGYTYGVDVSAGQDAVLMLAITVAVDGMTSDVR